MTGYIGVTNHMGSRFTTSPGDLKPVLRTLKLRGLMFLDSRSSANSIAAQMAQAIGLPRAVNDRFIDREASRAAIDRRLAELERIARDTGAAVAMGFPYPVTLERLAVWMPTLDRKGLALAPLSAVADERSSP